MPTPSQAQRQFLELPDILADSGQPTSAVHTVRLHTRVTAFFTHELVPGFTQAGGLFGFVETGVLHVTHASGGGYLRLSKHDPERVLELDRRYELGYADALRATAEIIDWVGPWLAERDLTMPGQAAGRRWIAEAAGRHLLSPVGGMLFVGRATGRVQGQWRQERGDALTTPI